MYKTIEATRETEPLYSGIVKSELDNNVHIEIKYKHGEVGNMLLTGTDKNAVRVPGVNLAKLADTWGLKHIFPGSLQVLYTRKKYQYNLSIINRDHEITYICNSRKVIAEINELERVIKAGRKLEQRDTNRGYYTVPINLLITASLCNNPKRTVLLLNGYHTSAIVSTIKSQLFRHVYKLIHPETEFIKTPIENK